MTAPNDAPNLPFSHTWPLGRTRAWLVHLAQWEGVQNDPASREAWTQAARGFDEQMERSLLGHLRHQQTQGLLKPADPMGREVVWVAAWNRMVAGTADGADEHRIVQVLAAHLDQEAMRFQWRRASEEGSDSDDEAAARVHGQLVAQIESGTWRGEFGDGMTDFRQGDRIHIALKDGRPALGVKNRQSGFRFQELTERLDPPGVFHVTFDAPTGELWIQDWFAMDAFTEFFRDVDKRSYAGGPDSIETLEGRERRTRAYAERNVLHVSVNNSSPTLVAGHGRLMVGELTEAAERGCIGTPQPPDPVAGPRLTPLRPISTNLWWATVADRRTLAAILSARVSPAEAEAFLDAYAAEHRGDLQVVHVPPGTYHAYAAGSPGVFHRRFAAEGVDTQPFERLMFVVSPHPLVLCPRPEPAPTEPHASNARSRPRP